MCLGRGYAEFYTEMRTREHVVGHLLRVQVEVGLIGFHGVWQIIMAIIPGARDNCTGGRLSGRSVWMHAGCHWVQRRSQVDRASARCRAVEQYCSFPHHVSRSERNQILRLKHDANFEIPTPPAITSTTQFRIRWTRTKHLCPRT